MITGVFSVDAAVFDGGDQIEIVLASADRRHEDVQPSVPRLDAQRRAHDAVQPIRPAVGGAWAARPRLGAATAPVRRRAGTAAAAAVAAPLQTDPPRRRWGYSPGATHGSESSGRR